MTSPQQNVITEFETSCGAGLKVIELFFNSWRKEIAIKVKPAKKRAWASRRSWQRTVKFTSPEQLQDYIDGFNDIESALETTRNLNELAASEGWSKDKISQELRSRRSSGQARFSSGEIYYNRRFLDTTGNRAEGEPPYLFYPRYLGGSYDDPIRLVEIVKDALTNQL